MVSCAVTQLDEKQVDDFIERVLRKWQIPGLALAALAGPSFSLVKGYGFRELGSADPVTPETVFTIGSLSKAFTAAALALLADEEKVSWDLPVRHYIPEFALADQWISGHATIRDLLAHRIGWEEHYWLNFANRLKLTREEIVGSLKAADIDNDFRSRFAYSNLMYVVAGEVIPTVTSQTWDEFVADRLFRPLSMNSTSTCAAQLLNSENHASPHIRDHTGRLRVDSLKVDDWWTMDNHGASGSVNSTAIDLISWMQVHMPGFHAGPHLLSKKSLSELHSPHMLVGLQENDEAVVNLGYGLGWQVARYREQQCSYHEGAFRGMSAYMALFPELGCGVAVLANSRDAVKGNLTRAVGQWVADRLLGCAEYDWESEARNRYDDQLNFQTDTELAWTQARKKETLPSLPLQAYAGVYRNPSFTSWVIDVDDGNLVVNTESGAGPYQGVLEHWHHDVFVSKWNDHLTDYWPSRFVRFSTDSASAVSCFHFCSDPDRVISTFRRDVTATSR